MTHRLCRISAALTLALSVINPHAAIAQSAIRDSAGVRITPITLRGATGAVRMGATPTVDIGGATNDSLYELNQVRGIVRLHDGTIVVANGKPQQLRFFDTHGRLLRTAGRNGSGPGEFQVPSRLFALRGDTLVVYDGMTRRIVLFAPNGTTIGTHPLIAPQGRAEPIILGAFQDQHLVAGSSDVETAAPRPAAYYFRQHAFVYALDAHPGQDLGSFGNGEHFVQHMAPQFGGVAYWDLAFGRQTTIATRGNDILVGDGSSFELQAYNRSGTLTEILRANVPAEPLTGAERNAYRQAALKDLQPSDLAVETKRVDEMPYPKTIPAFKRFFVADDGRIWMQRYPHVGDAKERWVVLSARGEFLDELTMPARFRLSAAGASFALGVYRDDDDVEHVQQYVLGSR